MPHVPERKATPLFRGDPSDDMVVLPIDPERAHRYGDNPLHANSCYFCGRPKVSDFHSDDAVQRTVSYRAEYGG